MNKDRLCSIKQSPRQASITDVEDLCDEVESLTTELEQARTELRESDTVIINTRNMASESLAKFRERTEAAEAKNAELTQELTQLRAVLEAAEEHEKANNRTAYGCHCVICKAVRKLKEKP